MNLKEFTSDQIINRIEILRHELEPLAEQKAILDRKVESYIESIKECDRELDRREPLEGNHE